MLVVTGLGYDETRSLACRDRGAGRASPGEDGRRATGKISPSAPSGRPRQRAFSLLIRALRRALGPVSAHRRALRDSATAPRLDSSVYAR